MAAWRKRKVERFGHLPGNKSVVRFRVGVLLTSESG